MKYWNCKCEYVCNRVQLASVNSMCMPVRGGECAVAEYSARGNISQGYPKYCYTILIPPCN